MNLTQWLLFIGLYLALAIIVLAPVCVDGEPVTPAYPGDPQDDPDYQKFVEEMAEQCFCTPLSERPCDGLLSGGVCDEFHLEPEHTDQEFYDEHERHL